MKLLTLGEIIIDFVSEMPVGNEEGIFYRFCGGSAMNVISNFVSLGGSGSIISSVGEDAFGDSAISELEEKNVNYEGIIRNENSTTRLVFVHNIKNEPEYIPVHGVNLQYDYSEIQKKLIRDAEMIYLDASILCKENLFEEIIMMLDNKEGKIPLIGIDLNIIPYGQDVTVILKNLSKIAKFTKFLKMSEENLKVLNKILNFEQEDMVINGIDYFKETGFVNIIVTKGKNGYIYSTEKYDLKEIEIKEIKAISGSGAGDSFTAGIFHELNCGEDMENAIEKANIYTEIVLKSLSPKIINLNNRN